MPTLQAKAFATQTRLFEGLGRLVGNKTTAIVCVVVAIGLGAGCIAGLSAVERETSITELYSHRDSRLRPELAYFEDVFGGVTRTEATIHQAADGTSNMASQEGFTAIIDSITPLYKQDETEFCDQLDNVATTVDCSVMSAAAQASSLYCQCQTIAASPDQIKLEWPTTDGNKINVTIVDVCEKPPVPSVLAPSKGIVYEPHETALYTDPRFVAARDALVAQQEASLSIPAATAAAYEASRSTILTAMQTALQTDANTKFNADDRMDLVAGGLQAGGTGAAAVAPFYVLAVNGALDSTAITTAAGAMVLNPASSTAALEAAYDSVAGSGGSTAAPIIQAQFANFFTHGGALSTAIVTAVGSIRFGFASQRNFFGYGYTELAACIADKTSANRATLEGATFGGLQTADANGADWAAAGITAVQAATDTAIANGVNPLFDSPTQAQLGLAYVQAAAATHVQAALTAASITINAATIPTLLGLAFAALGAGDITTAVPDMVAALMAAPDSMSAGDATTAATVVLGGINTAATLAEGVVTAVVQSKALFMPEHLTVNGQLRPLPRTWGVDRFPCTRATALDVFREGDFDYPYRLKQLQQVSQYVYYWFNQASAVVTGVGLDTCLNDKLLQPTRDALYFSKLGDHLSSYQTANFAALSAAETAFLVDFATTGDSTSAVTAALTAFGTGGGQEFPATAPTTGQAPTPAFQAVLGPAIAEAAGTAAALESNFGATNQAYFGFGYWHRPSFGTHFQALRNMTEAEVVSVLNDGILAANNPDVGNQECISHTGPSDETIQGCFMAWSTSKLPYELSIGNLKMDNDTLTSVGASRTAGSVYNEANRDFRLAIGETLGREVDYDDASDLLYSFETAVIKVFKQFWAKDADTPFGAEGSAQDQSFYFNADRSVGDVVDEASDLETILVVGGYLAMIAYTLLVFTNFSNSVYSHGMVAVISVFVIAFSTAASLGLTAWLGIRFSPISSNVIPFMALGIGIDDAFVIITAYMHEVAEGGTAREVLGRAMGEAGPSVLFTSVINFVAFGVGSSMPILVVQLFCQQMMVSVFLNFLFLILLLLPALYLDGLRVSADNSETCISCGDNSGSPRDAENNIFSQFYGDYYAPFLMKDGVRVAVLVIFFAGFGLLAWQGFTQTDSGIRISTVAVDGTYQFQFASRLETMFQMFSGTLVTTSNAFDTAAAQENILATTANLQKSVWVSETTTIRAFYWLHDLLESSNTDDSLTPITGTAFYEAIGAWLGALGITALPDLRCANEVTEERVSCFDIIDPAGGINADIKLTHVRGAFYIPNLVETDDFLDAIRDTRKRTDEIVKEYTAFDTDPDYDSFVAGYIYTFWQQYLSANEDLYTVVGLCLAGIFGATLLLQFSISTSLFLCLVILMVGIEVFGFLPVLGIQLNAFSSTNVVLSLGMSIEFTSHIAHQFLVEPGANRKERVVGAMRFMGAPMFHGAMSSVLAVCFIAGSKTPFLREYYFQMFAMIIFIAFINGTMLLPVILSFLGAPNVSGDTERRKSKAEKLVEEGHVHTAAL